MNSKVLIWLFWQFIVRLQKCVGIEPTLILIVNNTSKVTLLKGFISVMHSDCLDISIKNKFRYMSTRLPDLKAKN